MSATGRPMLANDPHRPIQLPSLRKTVHLVGPGWNAIGAGEPALPGIALGHNESIAWGFTTVGIDQQDLYVEKLDPAEYLDLVERYRITHSQVVPTMFSRLLKLPDEVRAAADVSSLEAIVHSIKLIVPTCFAHRRPPQPTLSSSCSPLVELPATTTAGARGATADLEDRRGAAVGCGDGSQLDQWPVGHLDPGRRR